MFMGAWAYSHTGRHLHVAGNHQSTGSSYIYYIGHVFRYVIMFCDFISTISSLFEQNCHKNCCTQL